MKPVRRDLGGWGHNKDGNFLTRRVNAEASVDVGLDLKNRKLIVESQSERGSLEWNSVSIPLDLIFDMLEEHGIYLQDEQEEAV